MRVLPLGEVCKMYQPPTISTKEMSEAGEFVVYGANGRIGRYEKYNHKEPQLLLTCRGATCGAVNISEPFAWINGNAMVIQPKAELATLSYMKYAFLGGIDVSPAITGSAQPQITRTSLEVIEIPLPSLEKQGEIVEKLDSAFAEIDLLDAIYAKRNEDLSDHLFNTFRDDLLISSSNDQPRLEFGEIGNFVRGPFGGSLKKSIFKKSGLAVYEQQHAIYEKFTSFRYFVDEEKYQEMKRFEVKEGDLIMSCSGTYGKIAVVPKGSPKGIINQALLKITPNKGVSGPFIKHWMQSGLFQSELEKGVGGAALQNVPSVAIMKSIKIHLPQEADQLKILEKLEQFESMMSEVMSIQSQIRRNYLELRQSLLSSAFTQGEEVA